MKYELLILSYNNLDKLAYCIESIRQYSFYTPIIKVIDNGSKERIKEFCEFKKVECIPLEKNELYTKPYADYLLKNKQEKYFCLMNNDCIVEQDWDKHLIDYLEGNPKTGIAAPMLVDITGKMVQNMGGLQDFCSHKADMGVSGRNWWKDPEKNIWTTFACVMVRDEAYKKVGGFDTQFMFYCSDSDLCLRMLLADYKIYNIPASKVRHFHMASTRQVQAKINAVAQQDFLRFNVKWERHGIRINNKEWFIKEVKI